MKNAISKIFNDKKKILLLVISLVICGFIIIRSYGEEYDLEDLIPKSETSVIERGSFQEIVTENGRVASENYTLVYPNLQSPILQVRVKEGDQVKKGDVLAVLDTSSVKEEIAKRKEEASENSLQRNKDIEEAQANLNEALAKMNTSSNPKIKSTEEAINKAYNNWQKVSSEYEDQKKIVADLSQSPSSNEPATSSGSDSIISQIESDLTTLNTRKSDIEGKISQTNKNISVKEHERASYMNIVSQHGLSYSGPGDIEAARARIGQLRNEENASPASPSPSQELGEDGQPVEAPEPVSPVDHSQEIASLESGISAMESVAGLDSQISSLKGELAGLQSELSSIDSERARLNSQLENVKSSTSKEKEEKKEKISKNEEKLALAKTKLSKLETEVTLAEKTYLDTLQKLDLEKLAREKLSKENANEIKKLREKLSLAKSKEDELENLNLSHLENQLDNQYVLAPIDGIVTEVNITEGQVPKDHIVKIATDERSLVKSRVNSYDIDKVQEGMEVLIEDIDTGIELTRGRVESLYPLIDKRSKLDETLDYLDMNIKNTHFKSLINFDDQLIPELKPGMEVRVKYLVTNKEGVIVVPRKSILRDENSNRIYIINRLTREVESIAVSIHEENEYQTIIESPDLKEGIIYLNYPENFHPGQKVKIIETNAGNTEPLDLNISEKDMKA